MLSSCDATEAAVQAYFSFHRCEGMTVLYFPDLSSLTHKLLLIEFAGPNSLSAMSDENMQHEITTLWVGNGSF